MSRRDTWKTLAERFDPYAYVPDAWRATRSQSPEEKIVRLLDGPEPHKTRVLVVGTIGTGKTTELLRVREARELKEFVVFLDLARYFDRLGSIEGLQHVTQWEVCFLAGLAIAGAYAERFEALPKHFLRDLGEAYQAAAKAASIEAPASLDLAKAAKTMLSVGATIATAIGAGPAAAAAAATAAAASEALHWNVPIGRSRTRVVDDDIHVKSVLDRVNAIIAEIQATGAKVFLVIDGLDRIHDRARAVELFVDSRLIAQLECRMVVCGPYALRHGVAAASVRGFRVLSLVNEAVLDQHAPTEYGPGIAFFRELFMRRTHDLDPGLIDEDDLDRLAYMAGGRARDFVKMVRMTVENAWFEDTPTITAGQVDAAIDEERRLAETGLHTGHIGVLRQVRDDPRHRLPDGPLVDELLVYSKLLPYPDGSEWYYPHPLLTQFLA